jgi:hypothetical protein
MLALICGWGLSRLIRALFNLKKSDMETADIRIYLKQFHGTSQYHKHLFPGKSPILITDGCQYVRDVCNAYWLFDAILSYQREKVLKGINFQVWELKRLKVDLSWQLTCREDTSTKPLIRQSIEFSDFPIDYIKIWVIDKVALLPSEY